LCYIKANRRLTSPRFLGEYRKILRPGGAVNLKTDSPELYAFTWEVLAETPDVKVLYDKDDIYRDPLDFPELEIQTYYERMHLAEGRKIKFVRFALR
jgi:tRNA (guanine-N7-)-methyltransferase